MAIQVVNLTDTFDEWRVKSNLTASNFGDLSGKILIDVNNPVDTKKMELILNLKFLNLD